MLSFYLIPTFVFFVHFVLLTEQSRVTNEERLNMLETLIRLETQRRVEGIGNLQAKIRDISAIDRPQVDAKISENIAKRLDEIENKEKSFMEEITVKIAALEKGLVDEKILVRRNKDVLSDAIQKQTQEIEAQSKTIQSLEDKQKQEAISRETHYSKLLEMIKELNNSFHGAIARMVIDEGFPSRLSMICSNPWFKYANNCYLYVEDKETWHGASMRCLEHNAKLAEPDDKKTLDELFEQVGDHVWVGGTDEAQEGVWVWVGINKNIAHLPWGPGQPNSHGGDQDCLEIFENGFNDEDCSARNKYICEKEAVMIF